MTYEEFFRDVWFGVQLLENGVSDETPFEFSGVQTTPIRLAVKRNRDRVQPIVDRFGEVVQEQASEGGLKKERQETLFKELALEQEVPDVEWVDDDLRYNLRSLLDQEVKDFTPYKVTEEEIKQEPNLPIPVLDAVDWMIE